MTPRACFLTAWLALAALVGCSSAPGADPAAASGAAPVSGETSLQGSLEVAPGSAGAPSADTAMGAPAASGEAAAVSSGAAGAPSTSGGESAAGASGGGSAAGAPSASGSSAGASESGSANSESSDGAMPTGRPGQFGGQTGGEAGIRCNADVELQPLDFAAVAPSGYSAAEILSGLAPSYAGTFTYADDSTTALSVRLASDGERAAYAPGCSRNAIDVSVDWSTADGAFQETLRGKLFSRSPEAATLNVELPAANLAGSYASTHGAELGPPPVSFTFELAFDPSAVHGSVSALRGASDNQTSLAIGSF